MYNAGSRRYQLRGQGSSLSCPHPLETVLQGPLTEVECVVVELSQIQTWKVLLGWHLHFLSAHSPKWQSAVLSAHYFVRVAETMVTGEEIASQWARQSFVPKKIFCLELQQAKQTQLGVCRSCSAWKLHVFLQHEPSLDQMSESN